MRSDTVRGSAPGGIGRWLRIARIAIWVVVGIAFLAIAGRLLMGPPEPTIEPGSALVVDLSGAYVEAPEPSWMARILGEQAHSFAAVNSMLAMAARDDRLDTVVLRIGGLDLGWGKAQQLRDAIDRLREAGRRTVAYLEVSRFDANREYYVASAADRIVVPPGGVVPVVGLAAEYMYLGGLWEKLGVHIDVERIGRYKSAAESIAGTEMSEAAREMADSILDSIDAQFVDGIAAGRALEREQARTAIDAGPVVGPELEALGLIDARTHLSDVLEEFGDRVVEDRDYARVSPETVGFDPAARFALVYASGPVVVGKGSTGRSGQPVAASETVAEALHDAAEDPGVRAVILRVDSPGGSPLASELIWHAVAQVQEKGKPVVASFSDVAASGGYYLAAGADTIVAPAGAYTGSIGVFVLRPVLSGLFEKLGIHVASLTRGKSADFLLSTRPLSPGTRGRLRALVVDTYDLFVERVADGRDMQRSAVDALGQGRVWTGEQAFERELVDEIGGLHEAVAAGKRAVGLDEDVDVALVLFPKPEPLAAQLADILRLRVAHWAGAAATVPFPIPGALERLRAWIGELPLESPLLVPPVAVDVR